MCGICGVVALNGKKVSERIVTSMRDTMIHRGPDDAGTWVGGPVGLGNRRLSILDLTSAGHQPMISTDGASAISYNGEVYNYKSLRQDLSRKGFRFRSESDTEVVLAAYQAWGLDSIPRLDGMFAFAIWDSRLRRLVLTRDRMGIKPLYYAVQEGELGFSSEIKALLIWKPSLRELRAKALEEHLIFRDVAGEQTLFQNVYRLLPGHVLVTEGGTIRTQGYWSLPFGNTTNEDREVPGPDLLWSLKESIALQMVSDVPVGTLCSGGLDSSLVTALASDGRNQRMHSFAVGFRGFEGDESRYAGLVADHVGTDHHLLEATPTSFADDLVSLVRHNDEPLGHENSVFVYQICRLAKENGVTVVLTGEGADELFAGYSHVAFARRLSNLRRWHSSPLSGIALRWGGSLSPHRLIRWAYALGGSEDDLVLFSTAYVAASFVAILLGQRPALGFEYRRQILSQTQGMPLPDRVRWMDLATYLPPILVRQDKMSMAASVEARVPFLGNQVVDWACIKPLNRLISQGMGKAPLRDIARPFLPGVTLKRPKNGFAVPFDQWSHSSPRLASMIRMLEEPNCRVGGVLDRDVVARIVQQHFAGQPGLAQILWVLLSLEIWMREVLDGTSHGH